MPESRKSIVCSPNSFPKVRYIELVRQNLDGRNHEDFETDVVGAVIEPTGIESARNITPLRRTDQARLAEIKHLTAEDRAEACRALAEKLYISFLQIHRVAHGVGG